MPPQPDEYQKKKRKNDRRSEPKSLHSGKGDVVIHRERYGRQKEILPRYNGEDDRPNKNYFDHLVHRTFYAPQNMRSLSSIVQQPHHSLSSILFVSISGRLLRTMRAVVFRLRRRPFPRLLYAHPKFADRLPGDRVTNALHAVCSAAQRRASAEPWRMWAM
jgi:hypothetical protein